ncbi:MAG: hypothetical protein Q7R49_06875 [Candidatus Daviesbacteria bacterium]|nr:hypothetical protein [Candidatus Daviesbacteria bacterium]
MSVSKVTRDERGIKLDPDAFALGSHYNPNPYWDADDEFVFSLGSHPLTNQDTKKPGFFDRFRKH